MKLTAKSTGKLLWREPGNRFFIEIDGSPVELKYTLAQCEAYQNLIRSEKGVEKSQIENLDQAELIAMRMNKSTSHSASVVEIALSPSREKQYTIADIQQLFSEHLDLLQIIARTYIEKKIFNPVLDSILDPHLAP